MVVKKKGVPFSRVFQGCFSINSRDFSELFAFIFSCNQINQIQVQEWPHDTLHWQTQIDAYQLCIVFKNFQPPSNF